MARAVAVSVENQFNKGLITEASGLNFPENACTETFDCVFNTNGTVVRRLGYEYEAENDFVNVASDISGNFISEYVWNSVANYGNLVFVVQQVGDTLHFFETSSTTGLSNNRKTFTVALNDHLASGAPGPEGIACQFTSGNGDLFVFHPYCEPFYVAYDVATDTISDVSIVIQVRDFVSQDDGFEVEERPTTLTNEHKYNLYNQGWYTEAKNNAGTTINVLTHWDNVRSDFPSNADVWWLFKDTNEDFAPSTQVGRVFRGNSPAPNGHYILDAFYQDRSGASGITGVAVESSSYFRPAAGSFFSSRVFYGGVNYGDFGNKIYFTSIIQHREDYAMCHQINDPTSQELSDLYPTDGGVILIPEMGSLIKLVPYSTSLIVFATNGVWAISGSSAAGFAANDYSVRKISSIPSVSHLSFVDVEGSILWWNSDGIYILQSNPASGDLSISSATDQTIKDFINAVPAENVQYIKGAYNSLDKIVQWLFKSDVATDLEDQFHYNRILNFKTTINAFYPWTIPDIAPYIAGIFATKGFGVSRETANVIDSSGNTVIDGSSNNVVVSAISQNSETAAFRYSTILVSTNADLTYAQERNTSYLDWETETDGTDYDSYFISGYKAHGQGQRKFQGNYLYIFSESESNSSAFAQYVWDYATGGGSGRISNPEQVYLSRTNVSITPRRVLLRGQGLVLQLKFYSETSKPFNIVGWSMFETGNQTP